MTHHTADDLTAWLAELADAVEVPVADVPVDRVLDLARDVAHGVVRAGAPLTAFVVGVAIGRGLGADEAWQRVGALVQARASSSALAPRGLSPRGGLG